MKHGSETHDALLTTEEVAHILRVNGTTVRRWIKDGSLEAVILPHCRTRQAYRIKRSIIDALLGGESRPHDA